MASPLISAGEVEWITRGIGFNLRNDGRSRDEYRPLEVRPHHAERRPLSLPLKASARHSSAL